ncbi:cbb3-type cytochrome c oxidase N-terminal domain-containing protein [Lutibacter sp. B1]|uniref:cbb3-type cytochrome c oxidase N-terminal domain-containing protein n=1 Tax=Lutibacter sp. B1 TaxID=2725996 RepID=UPI0014567AA5|nr:cbb3-type cytochrome c oxidase N-terminal domain-containing protein [Lutibacter sp. B1]NLP57921.1 c-type cytochrome [Lutibacter sp. B1]
MNKNSEKISGWKRFLKSMTKAKEIENEEDIMLDHDYDGIKELDNVLPPWWLAGFYITIAISIFYYTQVFFNSEKYSQAKEYATEVAEGKAAIEQYKKEHPELFDDSNIVALTDDENIAKGKELFNTKTCTACHLADLGGSIGPNLTDNTWINGENGGVKDIYTVITKGGRPGKGMIAWESTISREERIQLASYIISMQGSTPANPKAPEGDIIWPKE